MMQFSDSNVYLSSLYRLCRPIFHFFVFWTVFDGGQKKPQEFLAFFVFVFCSHNFFFRDNLIFRRSKMNSSPVVFFNFSPVVLLFFAGVGLGYGDSTQRIIHKRKI